MADTSGLVSLAGAVISAEDSHVEIGPRCRPANPSLHRLFNVMCLKGPLRRLNSRNRFLLGVPNCDRNNRYVQAIADGVG